MTNQRGVRVASPACSVIDLPPGIRLGLPVPNGPEVLLVKSSASEPHAAPSFIRHLLPQFAISAKLFAQFTSTGADC